ncbi:hypothetical protein HYU95_03655 [Candidatus Daviesbacteria bacterium]|nr:hypothetical protein [Candidatus Daviesbacteria bacterium]
MAQAESYNPERTGSGERSRTSRRGSNMAEGTSGPGTEVAVPSSQVGNIEPKSPIAGMPPDLYETLTKRHSLDVIQLRQAQHQTHEEFLEDAEQEAARIRAELADTTPTLPPQMPLVPGQVVNGKVAEEAVLRNAGLGDEDRKRAAGELLYGEGKELSEQQKQALLRMHEVGKDRPGAGVFNYNPAEIKEKVRIGREKTETGEEVFNAEERRKLFEAGLVGILPPSEFTALEKNVNSHEYDTEPGLKRIIEQVVATGKANRGDEQFLRRISTRIEGLVDGGAVQDAALAQQVLTDLEGLRITAEMPPVPETPPVQSRSYFEQIFDRLENARRTGNAALEQAEISNIRTLFSEIDALKKPNGERIDLFKVARDPLVKLFYDSRVGVGQKEKLGIDEYKGQGGVLERLGTLQQVLNPNVVIEDRTGRVMQIVNDSGIFLGEEQSGYWDRAEIAAIENMQGDVAAFKQKYGMNTLEEGIGGCIDYFNREGLNMVAQVVNDRRVELADNGIQDIWDTVITNKMGRPLKDDDGIITAKNFADVREIIQGARIQNPWIPNRGDYETWIQFVADDVEELREMSPYIIIKVVRKLGSGDEETSYQTLKQEKGKMDSGLAAYDFETASQFRRAVSEISGDFNLQGSEIFSERVRKGWDGFFHFSEFIASSCEDTKYQDHFADAVLLDKHGETMLALEEFSKDDGIFWRYGEKSVDTATKAKVAELQRWQIRRRKEIEKSLMEKKLRRMDDLLNLTLDQHGNITGYGVPNHPAFQRLKAKYDLEDSEDKAKNNGRILDADKNPTTETRWVEYCRKALQWEKTGEFGDPREAERVTFQHPLARVLRPVGYVDVQSGVTTAVDELDDMFEDDPRVNTDSAYKRAKRRRIKNTLDKAEKVARAFLVDSMSALAWFTPEVRDPETDEIDQVKTQAMVAKFNRFLEPARLPKISDKDTVPYKTLYRVIMQALLREDQAKPPAKRRFKFHYLLTKMGFDLDLPTYAAWNLGAHDTGRPAVMLDGVYKDIVYDANHNEVGLRAALKTEKKSGLDEKNAGAKWAEEERRMHLLVQLVMRQMFPKYFNYPGHDTKGAGVKDIRNILDPIYGISARTSWISDLTDKMLMGEQDPAKDYGGTRSPLRQWLGLVKGGDEVIFRQTGYAGIIEGPRDMEAWLNRFKKVVAQYESMTKGSKEGGPGILKSGPFSGMFRWTNYSRGHLKIESGYYKSEHVNEEDFAIKKPSEAIQDSTEAHRKDGIELAGSTIGPLLAYMKNTVESTFGRNPESAKFLNTLLWYAVSKWMDTSPEYRSKPGYAIDGNLHLARYFMHTVLQEDEGLIYSDTDWDKIMLGYVKKSDKREIIRYKVRIDKGVEQTEEILRNNDGTAKGAHWVANETDDTVVEGLIDSFPKELRDEILNGQKMGMLPSGKYEPYEDSKKSTYKTVIIDYWLPFGMHSRFPETMATYYTESPVYKETYKSALGQIRPRQKVERP